jgi:PAT family beta-lactamase induction signal transducer AmpG
MSMNSTLTLLENPRIRYLTGAMMYFAQGIPAGLLGIAIPAWLVSQGVSASDIGSYLAVIVLPWVFKLLTGPLMDRFEFAPMGRRRPWVLAAQLGLSVSFLAFLVVEDPVGQIGLLMMIGVLVNIFAATQDVAVDGMSIDLTPVNEQGRLNAYMSFGKAVGWSATSAVSGLMLVNFGLQATALAAAIVSIVFFFAFVFVLERPGERRLPWSSGEAASARQEGNSFRDVFSGVNKVLWKRASVMVIAIMVVDGLISGYGHALMPIAAVKVFGFTSDQWSQLVALMGLIGAGLTLALGPMIDRFGSKRMLIVTISLVGVHAFLLAQTQFLWTDTTYVKVMLSIWVILLPVVMVCVIALGMSVCSSSSSATQFAIYMSAANLGHSAGSKIFGMVSEQTTYTQSYMLMAVLVIGMVVVLLFHRHQHNEEEAIAKKGARTFTVSSTTGGGGVFWSGAMRCPKCRSDMVQIDVDGTEVDRCNTCNGLWFDAGEVEALRSKETAALIDTGSARQGRELNIVDDYRCPRCGGEMHRTIDEQQRHIKYETCEDCNGSFFDAGEFLDLSQLTLSDFFKRWTTPRSE